jgi:hypothetical protein
LLESELSAEAEELLLLPLLEDEFPSLLDPVVPGASRANTTDGANVKTDTIETETAKIIKNFLIISK